MTDDSLMSISSMQNNLVATRINPEKIIKKVESFLSGKKIVIKYDDNGEPYEDWEQYSDSFCNKEGVNSILHMLIMAVNEMVIQGNYVDVEAYTTAVADIRRDLTEAIILNVYEWDIQENKINMIINGVMWFVESVLTRLIENKERESLMPMVRSHEVVRSEGVSREQRGLRSLISGRNNE